MPLRRLIVFGLPTAFVVLGVFVGAFWPRTAITRENAGSAGADRGGEALQAWPQWRGPLGTGVAPNAQPPIEWSETRHILLTTAIPYGDAVKPRFIRPGAHDNLAMTRNHAFVVLAVSRTTGKSL
jgi:hypothetical protein